LDVLQCEAERIGRQVNFTLWATPAGGQFYGQPLLAELRVFASSLFNCGFFESSGRLRP
jgi:hypothetical protein